MRLLKIAALVAVCSCFLGAGKKTSQSFVITFHEQGDENQGPKFVQGIRLGSEGVPYYFSRLPTFTDKDIAWFYPFVSKDGRSLGAAFQLKPAATKSLQAVTAKSQGRLLGIRVVEGPNAAVLIDRPIEDGVIVLWEGLQKAHLQMFKHRFPHVEDVQRARGIDPRAATGE